MSRRASKLSTRLPSPAPAGWWVRWWDHPLRVPLFLALITVLAYLPVLGAGFIWDDDDYVTQNLTLRSLDGLRRIWFELGATPQYYPLVHSTFWVEYHLWGLNPFGYHLVNVLLQALGSILLWRVLVRLAVPGAWLAAGLFAIHPVGVESVAWVTERKNVLCGVFYFAAALCYLRFNRNFETGEQPQPGKTFNRHYWLALLFFVGALWSKTVACTLPAALLLVCWWKRERITRRDVWQLLPFFVLGAGLGLLTAHIEKTHVGAQGADWALSFGQRLLIAGRALWFYAGKLAWPAELAFIYPRWVVSPAIWWQWIFPAAAVAAVLTLWMMRRRFGRGPLVAVLFFAGTLFPALGFINTYPMRYSFVADHFQYLAAIGLLALVAAGLSRLPGWVGVVLLLGLGGLTARQTHIYHDPVILWRDTLNKNPRCFLAHNDLGLLLKQNGRRAEAEAEYRAALADCPDYEEAMNNLAVILADSGRADEAIETLQKVVRAHPDHFEVIHNLGYALAARGRFTEAIDCYQTVLRTCPQSAQTHFCLGEALAGLGRADEAVGEYQLALQCRPAYAEAHCALGIVLARLGRVDEALAHFRAAVQFRPNYPLAHNGLGNILLMRQQYQEALPEYEAALQAIPDYAEAHNNLGCALAGLGRLMEAVPHYQEALRLKPDYVKAHFNLGCALGQLGQHDGALAQLHEALRLQPDYPEARQKLAELDPSAPK